MTQPAVVWFRDDLRLSDHAALDAAAATGRPLICLYVLDEESDGLRPLGGAARWWLAQSLRALAASLEPLGQRLVLRRGRAADIVPAVTAEAGAHEVFWNRRIAGAKIDAEVEDTLRRDWRDGADVCREPAVRARHQRTNAARVHRLLAAHAGVRAPRGPLKAPKQLGPRVDVASDQLADWAFEPTKPDWAGGLREAWSTGEAAAQDRLADFLDGTLKGLRNPARPLR